MTRLLLLLLLLCILSCNIITLHAISRINLIHSLALTEDYDYVTTFSDSLLHFFRIDFAFDRFALIHWTCSPSGLMSQPQQIFTYYTTQNHYSGPGYTKHLGKLYINITYWQEHMLSVDSTINVQHYIYPRTEWGYCVHLGTDRIIYNHLSSSEIYSFNMTTNVEEFLMSNYGGYPNYIPIDNNHVFVHFGNWYNVTPQYNFLIDDQLSITNITVQYAFQDLMDYIQIQTQPISNNTYIALFGFYDPSWDEYYGCFGFIRLVNDYLYCTMLWLSEIWDYTYMVPYMNDIFSCVDNNENLFKNYLYTGSGFIEDNGFPNLLSYTNPFSLTRLSTRYALGIAGTNNNPRKFICIDYQNQSITDTTFIMIDASNIGVGVTNAVGDIIYYSYNNGTRHLYIMKIAEFVSNSNPTYSPAILSNTAYPNPFNNNTTIKIELKQPETLKVSIYNLKGQLVKTLSSNAKAALSHELIWDGTTKNNNKASAGLYIYKVSTKSSANITGKLLLQK